VCGKDLTATLPVRVILIPADRVCCRARNVAHRGRRVIDGQGRKLVQSKDVVDGRPHPVLPLPTPGLGCP